MRPSDITHIIVHCSDSRFGDAEEIRRWHLDRGWSDIGYHYVITGPHPKSTKITVPAADGRVETGRAMNVAGSHALGFNGCSVGVCLIGRGALDFTQMQMVMARKLVRELMQRFRVPVENVLGHYETPKSGGKTCPGMDMADFRRSLHA